MARKPSKSKPQPVEQLENELADFEALLAELDVPLPEKPSLVLDKAPLVEPIPVSAVVRRNFNN